MVAPDLQHWSTGRLLATAARHVEREWNTWLAERDLTHAGLVVLHALQDGSRTQRELAAASQVEEQTMARTVERLQRTGHLTRERDPADRRRLVIRPTSRGREVLADVVASSEPDALVTGSLHDPETFRAELVRLVRAAHGDVG